MLTNKSQHVQYLRETLIPDLIESGRLATAVDFETSCRLLENDRFHIAVPDNVWDFIEYLNAWRQK